jgi:hypothetical protein
MPDKTFFLGACPQNGAGKNQQSRNIIAISYFRIHDVRKFDPQKNPSLDIKVRKTPEPALKETLSP